MPGMQTPSNALKLPPHRWYWCDDDLARLKDFVPTHLLYLHGFRSSPRSAKARCMADWVARHRPELHWHCPALPPSPAQALRDISAWLDARAPERCAVMGSSLGGFYAHWLACAHNLPAVLINPAVHPARDLASHIGLHPAWHDATQQVFFEAGFVDELARLEASLGPHRPPSLALIATGDEVLDWREMRQRHGQGSHLLLQGSDHGLAEFELLLPWVTLFLRLSDPAGLPPWDNSMHVCSV